MTWISVVSQTTKEEEPNDEPKSLASKPTELPTFFWEKKENGNTARHFDPYFSLTWLLRKGTLNKDPCPNLCIFITLCFWYRTYVRTHLAKKVAQIAMNLEMKWELEMKLLCMWNVLDPKRKNTNKIRKMVQRIENWKEVWTEERDGKEVPVECRQSITLTLLPERCVTYGSNISKNSYREKITQHLLITSITPEAIRMKNCPLLL